MSRIDLANAPEVLLGLIEIVQVAPQHHRDLQQHAEIVGVALRLARRLIRRDQRRPVLRLHQHVGHRTQRLGLRWIEDEHALDRRIRAVGRRDPRAVQIGEHDQRCDLLLGRRRRIRTLLEQLREIRPPLGAPQEAREVERRLRVLGVDVEGLAQVLLGLLAVGREPDIGLRRRHVEPGREPAIGRRTRLLDVLLGELLPVLRGDVELLDRFARHRVVRPQRDHLIEGDARVGDIEQLAVEDHPLLEQQIDLLVELTRVRELGVDQRDDGIRPAAPREDLAGLRVSTRADIRRGGSRGPRQRFERLGIIRIVFEDSEK